MNFCEAKKIILSALGEILTVNTNKEVNMCKYERIFCSLKTERENVRTQIIAFVGEERE